MQVERAVISLRVFYSEIYKYIWWRSITGVTESTRLSGIV